MANNLITRTPRNRGVFHAQSTLADAEQLRRFLSRIAHEIDEHNHGLNDVVLIGIQRGGVPLAQEVQKRLNEIGQSKIPTFALDVSTFRDDIAVEDRNEPTPSDALPDLTDRVVVIVDDVLYTGRTVRAAFNALAAHGRPRAIQLAVAVDRGHREFPIRADYVGKNLPTKRSEEVDVDLKHGIRIGQLVDGPIESESK